MLLLLHECPRKPATLSCGIGLNVLFLEKFTCMFPDHFISLVEHSSYSFIITIFWDARLLALTELEMCTLCTENVSLRISGVNLCSLQGFK